MINNADCSLCVGQYEGCPPNKRLAITDHNGGRSQRHSCLDVNPQKIKQHKLRQKQANQYLLADLHLLCTQFFFREEGT